MQRYELAYDILVPPNPGMKSGNQSLIGVSQAVVHNVHHLISNILVKRGKKSNNATE